MQALAATNLRTPGVVRTMLFSFNDLPRLQQRARALLFDKADDRVVVLALRGTEADFREPCSPRWRRARAVWSKANSPTPLDAASGETEKARRQIVKLVLDMAQRGEIELLLSAERRRRTGCDAA